MNLNARALALADAIAADADRLRIAAHEIEGGGRVLDCGSKARGSLEAGISLARACLADLADVRIVPEDADLVACPRVQVVTDHPVAACLASQYAGWALSEGKFFAMGSGPMRAARGTEEVFDEIGHREEAPDGVVGVLEGRKLPTPEVVAKVAGACRVASDRVTLLMAPTASLAGSVQIVARSVETALHKLHALKFDVNRIISAHGSAPLPPVAKDDMAGIGRTNDAILYGARVTLYVTGDDESIAEVGPKVPSRASRDFGEPFAAIFARYNHDFYAVDPHLFSPASVTFANLETGRAQSFGAAEPEILARSFFG